MDNFDCFDPYDMFTSNWGPEDDRDTSDDQYSPWDHYEYDDMTNFGYEIEDY